MQREDAVHLIAIVAMQAAAVLRPYLPQLWDSEVDQSAWRCADLGEVARLQAIANDLDEDDDERRFALLCLLQTRRPEVLQATAASAVSGNFKWDLLDVGYTI